ncbi:MAG: hypothetical protein KIT11_06900 [Fimbriimonadaceae bacterium]|nr:hypothetical protein [Fimbriimonadaceae bacterium]QYK56080.1 MAG: hypothetical protein KF733_01090 [Fimbriimonadaceae bacterium]
MAPVPEMGGRAGVPGWPMAAAVALASAPALLVGSPPMVDYPLHIARVQILAHGANRFYAPDWIPIPNLGMDLLMASLLRVLPLDVGSRLFLAFVTVLLVTGTLALSKKWHGGWVPSVALAGLVVFDQWYLMGFVNFLFGIGLGLWVLALASPPEKGAFRPPWLWLLPVGALLAVVHLMAFLVTTALGVSMLAGRRWGHARVAKTILAAGIPLGALALGALALMGREPLSWPTRLWTWAQLWAPAAGGALVIGWILAIALAVFVFRGQVRLAPIAQCPAAVALVLTLVGPGFFAGTAYTSERVSLALVAVLAAGLTWESRAGQVSRAVVTAVAIRFALVAGLHWFPAAKAVDDFRALQRSAGREAMVVTARFYEPVPSSSDIYRHAADWGTIDSAQFVPQLFLKERQQPLKFLPGYDRLKPVQGNDPLIFISTAGLDSVLTKFFEPRLGFSEAYLLLVHTGQKRPEIEPGGFRVEPLSSTPTGDVTLYRVTPDSP